MGLPGHRRTHSDKHRRASHFALKPITLQACGSCGSSTLPHHVCPSCGAYKETSTKKETKKDLAEIKK